MNKIAEEFKKWHWKIYVNYFNAKIHLHIWWLLHDKKYIRFINMYKDHFSYEAEAQLRIGVLDLMKFFDAKKKTIGLQNFLKFCVHNTLAINKEFPECKFCNPSINKKILLDIQSIKNDLKEIKEWRDKLIAHEERGYKNRPIKWIHFQRVFDLLEKYFIDYGSKPNHIFVKPDKQIEKIRKFFDTYYIKTF